MLALGVRILCKQITSEKGKDCEEKLTGRIDLESELITCPQPLQDFCYGPLSCKYYSMGPAKAVPYKDVSGAREEGWLDEICVEYRHDPDE